MLAIKASHYRSDGQLRRLQAEVANFEALDQVSRDTQVRRSLRDDVKLFVWARDKGRCVACLADSDLHFDHRSEEQTPMRRNGTDAEIAAAVMFFATAPHYIPGQVLAVDGGLGL